MRRHGRLGLGLAAVALTAAVLVGVKIHDHSPSFPDAIPGTKTNVSSTDALRDHGITLPNPAHNLRYSAAHDDGYILDLSFDTTPAGVASFVAAHSFRKIGLFDADASVTAFAQSEGWKPTIATNRYAGRTGQGPDRYRTTVLTQCARQMCAVYLESW